MKVYGAVFLIMLGCKFLYANGDAVIEFLVCDKENNKLEIMENDCFDFVGDLQYNCLGIFNELMKNRNRDDYFDKIGQDKIVYYSQHDIYSTNCSKVEKIDIPSEYNMTDDPTLCYDDIPVLYWAKKTDDNRTGSVGFFNKRRHN